MLTRSGNVTEERLAVVLCFIQEQFCKELENEIDPEAFDIAVTWLLNMLEKSIPGIGRIHIPDPVKLLGQYGEGLFKKPGRKDKSLPIEIHPRAAHEIYLRLQKLGVIEQAKRDLLPYLGNAKKVYNGETLKTRCSD